MIREKELVASSELKKSWKLAIAPAAKAAPADFRRWQLYEHVGEPWPDAPSRFVRVASLSAVSKGLNSTTTEKLMNAANPGLRAMSSQMLNVRQQYFYEEWSSVEVVVWATTKKSLAELTKRQKWKPSDKEKRFWLYRPNTDVWQHVWEQLHPHAIEAPFHEHFLTIYRAGHVSAGLQGDNWKTCRFLYY